MRFFCSSLSASSHGTPSQRAMKSSHGPVAVAGMHVTRERADARVEPLRRGFEHADERAQEAARLRLRAPIDRRQVLHEACCPDRARRAR